jgi:hypothetical protein
VLKQTSLLELLDSVGGEADSVEHEGCLGTGQAAFTGEVHSGTNGVNISDIVRRQVYG